MSEHVAVYHFPPNTKPGCCIWVPNFRVFEGQNGFTEIESQSEYSAWRTLLEYGARAFYSKILRALYLRTNTFQVGMFHLWKLRRPTIRSDLNPFIVYCWFPANPFSKRLKKLCSVMHKKAFAVGKQPKQDKIT